MGNKDALRLPVVSLSAEHLAIGRLMRRNILTYKDPPNNEDYDLICIHPDPKHSTKTVRVQVKSRYQTDCDRAFPVKGKTFGALDYLIVVFLNIGYFYAKSGKDGGNQTPEFFLHYLAHSSNSITVGQNQDFKRSGRKALIWPCSKTSSDSSRLLVISAFPTQAVWPNPGWCGPVAG